MASAPTYLSYAKNKQMNFEIKSSKGKIFYITFINIGEQLHIFAYYNSNNLKIEYESIFEISYIKNVKLFILYDTLDECLDEIFAGINTGKSYLTEDDTFIKIYIPLNNIKFKEIMFKVDLKDNNNIKDIINKDNKDNKEYKEQITELKKVIKMQNNEIIDLKDKVEQLEYFVRDLLIFKKELLGKINFRLNSKIADSYFYILLLKNWIKLEENSNNKIIKSKLLYRLTKDGDTVEAFHKLCDNISPTLLLVETPDGKKFGGYTTCAWCMNKGGKKDGKTFLFSFDVKKMFKKKEESKNERDIYCRKDAGPIFGGNDLYFYQTLKKGYSLSPYYFLDNNDLAKNTKDDFDISEIEIFKVGFE